MADLKAEEKIQNINKLTQENMFTKSRKSISLSMNNDPKSKLTHPEKNVRPTDHKDTMCSPQPLMDLSNHETRNVGSPTSPTQNTLNRTFSRNLSIKDPTSSTPSSLGSLYTASSQFKLPTTNKSSWEAKRNAIAASNFDVHNRRRSKLGTLKENSNKCERSLTPIPSRTTVKNKSVVATVDFPFPLPPSRIKDPIVGSVFEKMKPRRHNLAIAGQARKTPLSSKKSPLIASSARRKKTDVFSSVKKIEPYEKRLNLVSIRSHLSQASSGIFRGKAQDANEECRRALQFQESFDERDEETTQPLSLVNLTILEQTNEGCPILQDHPKANPLPKAGNEGQADTTEIGKITKNNTFLVDTPSNRQQISKQSSRSFGIPVLRKTTSPAQSVRDTWRRGVHDSATNAVVFSRNKFTNFSMWRIDKRGGNPSRVIPDIKITQPSLSSATDSDRETAELNHSCSSFVSCTTVEASVAKISPSAPPNSPSPARRGWVEKLHRNEDHDAAPVFKNGRGKEKQCATDHEEQQRADTVNVEWEVKNPSRIDSSTNTILSSAHFNVPFSEVEGIIESLFLRQQTVLNSFDSLFQEMKSEFTRKSESLVEEFKATLPPFEALKKDLVEKMGTTHPHLEAEFIFKENSGVKEVKKERRGEKMEKEGEEKEKEETKGQEKEGEEKEKEETKGQKVEKNALSQFSCLDIPSALRNKQSMTRSFSHPLSPDTFVALPSCSRKQSFHSAESMCISPLTNFLGGDRNREYLMAMTPLMRRNVAGIEQSLSEQLNMLFD